MISRQSWFMAGFFLLLLIAALLSGCGSDEVRSANYEYSDQEHVQSADIESECVKLELGIYSSRLCYVEFSSGTSCVINLENDKFTCDWEAAPHPLGLVD